jgi:hypothetical protein
VRRFREQCGKQLARFFGTPEDDRSASQQAGGHRALQGLGCCRVRHARGLYGGDQSVFRDRYERCVQKQALGVRGRLAGQKQAKELGQAHVAY